MNDLTLIKPRNIDYTLFMTIYNYSGCRAILTKNNSVFITMTIRTILLVPLSNELCSHPHSLHPSIHPTRAT